jgi:Lipocalin-like domain
MKHLILPFIIASTLIFGVILPAEEAVAETANALVGTWSLVWLTNEQGGTRTDLFGPNPKGILMFDDNGHFCFLSTSGVLPNLRSITVPRELRKKIKP